MLKHAYLIMAHNNFYILDKLLRLLDDPRNDIYLHIDKKVKNFDFDGFRTICKHTTVYYPKKRINVQWGTQSQVLTEMLLFKTAYANGPYHYYHLLSGVDLPLKTQDEIHQFFEAKSETFLYFDENPSEYDVQRVSLYRNLFSKKCPFSVRLNTYAEILQQKFKIDRIKKQEIFIRKGSNWGSLSHEAVSVLTSNNQKIKRLTRFSVCADELYKQTILTNFSSVAIIRNDLREIRWSSIEGETTHPKTYIASDFDSLICSNNLFARKFDIYTNREIIDKLFAYIRDKSLSP